MMADVRMDAHECVLEVVVMDFRHEVRVVLDEVLQILWDRLFVLVRDQDFDVPSVLLISGVAVIDVGILDLPLKDSFDV